MGRVLSTGKSAGCDGRRVNGEEQRYANTGIMNGRERGKGVMCMERVCSTVMWQAKLDPAAIITFVRASIAALVLGAGLPSAREVSGVVRPVVAQEQRVLESGRVDLVLGADLRHDVGVILYRASFEYMMYVCVHHADVLSLCSVSSTLPQYQMFGLH